MIFAVGSKFGPWCNFGCKVLQNLLVRLHDVILVTHMLLLGERSCVLQGGTIMCFSQRYRIGTRNWNCYS